MTQVTLAGVAGRWTSRLGAISVPLYVTAFLITPGAGGWVLLSASVIMIAGIVVRRDGQRPSDGPAALVTCVLLHLAWAFLVPDGHALASVSLAITMTYVGLMALRPYAEIGLAAVPAAHLAAQFAGGAARGAEVEVIGAAVTSVLLGLLLFGTRLTTERRFAQALDAAAAANALLERVNRTDPLTGLANRRHLGEVLAGAWPPARELSVLMIDIDHFKPYNDHYGHLGGDRCLQQVAAALEGASPEADLVARFGGEEFIVVLGGAGREQTRAAGERVRQAVAGLALEHRAAPSGRVSVSVGAATARPGDAAGADDLIRRADEALYEAKRNGRDRVAA